MLLPEPHRSSLPFLASLAFQVSLVLLILVPWTVQSIRYNAGMHSPAALVYQPLKPPPPISDPQPQQFDGSRIFAPHVHREFVATRVGRVKPAAPDSLPFAPELGPLPAVGPSSDAVDRVFSPVAVPPPPPPPTQVREPELPRVIMVSGGVQAANLIRRVEPMYPALARQARIQGTVLLEAVIGADGSMEHLQVISGNPLLIGSAVQAVQQWRYRPTLLNGKPVEVRTTVEVRFILSER